MNLTISPATRIIPKQQISFKSETEMGGPIDGKVSQGDYHESSQDDSSNDKRYTYDDLENAANHSYHDGMFMGMLLASAGAILVAGANQCSTDKKTIQNINTQLEKTIAPDKRIIDSYITADINEDGANDIILYNSDGTQTIIDLHGQKSEIRKPIYTGKSLESIVNGTTDKPIFPHQIKETIDKFNQTIDETQTATNSETESASADDE